eukprot:TRINITY_DN35553_c0_g1_i1.p1 TRINITY_DN35553_c0_g1~~TRINITY_DN35553_c0_g1_i1.p1  ORF type:complete len:467 (+),score=113.38 TRINITY_DN35553_c0_g1_i1:58-1458(+)
MKRAAVLPLLLAAAAAQPEGVDLLDFLPSHLSGRPSVLAAAVRMGERKSCAECLRSGGAWCKSEGKKKKGACSIDMGGFCTEGPDDHVGFAGQATCDDEEGQRVQKYLLEPRGTAPLRMDSECSSKCASVSDLTVDVRDRDAVAETYARCGAVLLVRKKEGKEVGVLPTANLAALRKKAREMFFEDEISSNGKGIKKAMREVDNSMFYSISDQTSGDYRAEVILPFRKLSFEAVTSRSLTKAVARLLGVPPRGARVDYAVLRAAYPSAGSQLPYREDRTAVLENEVHAVTYLDRVDYDHDGPMEVCPCTHHQGKNARCTDTRVVIKGMPLGTVLLYHPGLFVRSFLRKSMSTSVSAALTFSEAGMRGRTRPVVLLRRGMFEEVQGWRSKVLIDDGDKHCSDREGCDDCRAAGCAWCSDLNSCRTDAPAACTHPDHHVGNSSDVTCDAIKRKAEGAAPKVQKGNDEL